MIKKAIIAIASFITGFFAGAIALRMFENAEHRKWVAEQEARRKKYGYSYPYHFPRRKR